MSSSEHKKPRVILSFHPAEVSFLDGYKDLVSLVTPQTASDMDTQELEEHLTKGADALIHHTPFVKLNEEWILKVKNAGVKIIANHGVGYDGVNVPEATKQGIIVTNTPGVVCTATAEIALSLILNISRRIFESEEYLIKKNWEKKLIDLMGNSLDGKILGLVGFGGIGKAVAVRAQAFGMRIFYHCRNRVSKEIEERFSATYFPNLDDMLPLVDYISIHIPLTPETRFLFDRERFSKLKDGVFFVNTARGAIVREQALIEALKSGKVKAAGLDVHETEPFISEELISLAPSKVVLLPHIGTQSVEARRDMLSLCFDNIIQVLIKHNPPLTPVNKI